MGPSRCILLVLTAWISFVFAEDLLFPYMHGLNYSEYDHAVKLGFSAHVCKDEAEWYAMTTADFQKYKAIIIPDCQCNTSLSTIKFLDDTKSVWSPAVTGNMVIIGTDPSFHHKWFKLRGADAMMNDSIKLVSTGKNGTGMYLSLSCYFQSAAKPVKIEALSEIGDFQVRGNLSHPCLNDAHLVAKSDVMTSLNDKIISNWNCSVHEAFSEYPTTGSGAFQALAIALNANGTGKRSFGDGTSGIPYIIARGATPAGCGNNKTETEYDEECDDGPANGEPGEICSSSCKCLLGMITPGVCRSNTTSSSTSSALSSTLFTNSSSIGTRTPLLTISSSSRGYTTISASISDPSTPVISSKASRTGPVTVTVFPSGLPPETSTALSPNTSVSEISPPKTVTVEPPVASVPTGSGPVSVLPPSPSESAPGTVPLQPPSRTESEPGTVTILPSSRPEPAPGTVTVQPPSRSKPDRGTVTVRPPSGTESSPVTITVRPPSPSQSAPGTVTVQPPRPSVSKPVSESPTSRGQVTVTASGRSDSQVPKPSTSLIPASGSSTYDGNSTFTASNLPVTGRPESSVSTPLSGSPSRPGDVTVTASGSPGTVPLGSGGSAAPSKSTTSPGNVTVTASGLPGTKTSEPRVSTPIPGSFSDPGDVTVTASDLPGTPQPSSPLPGPGTESMTRPGDVTVTASGKPGPQPPQSFVSKPSSRMLSSPVTTVNTASGPPGNEPPQTTITRGRSSLPSNPPSTFTAGPSGESRVPHSQSLVPPVTVTARPSGKLSSNSDLQTNTQADSLTGRKSNTSRLSTSSGTRSPVVTVTVNPSRQPISGPGSGNTQYTSKSGTLSNPQSNTKGTTATALPNQGGNSSKGTELDGPSTQSRKSSTTRASGGMPGSSKSGSTDTSLVDPRPQSGDTSRSTDGTQRTSQTAVGTGGAMSSTHRGSITSRMAGTKSTTLTATHSTTIPRSQTLRSPLSPPGVPGTVTIQPPQGGTSQYSSARVSNTLAPGRGSEGSSFTQTGSGLTTKRPTTNSNTLSGTYSYLPGKSSSSSRIPGTGSGTAKPRTSGMVGPSRSSTASSFRRVTGTKTGFPGSSGAIDPSGSSAGLSSHRATGTSHGHSTETNDPFKTKTSSGRFMTILPSIPSSSTGTGHNTYSRGPSMPIRNSTTTHPTAAVTGSSTAPHGIPLPSSSALGNSPNHCDRWVGIEIIHMIEITEVCPEGSTVTETITEITATMTRSICQTSATNLPCYPCVVGTPSSSHQLATVTVTSCSTSTEPTVTVTVQLCSKCTTTTYIGTVPGYTPGAPCHACSPYDPGATTAAIPPPVAISTSSPVIVKGPSPTTPTNSLPPPGKSSPAVPPAESSPPASSAPGRIPAGGGEPKPSTQPGGGPAPTTYDNNTPYGPLPTTVPATPAAPNVTAGTIRGSATPGYLGVVGAAVLGWYLVNTVFI